MKKISIKIGLLFFCLIFTMEVCLFFLLHQKITQTRIDEQLSALVTRGNNHRDVLETYYNEETIHHIALMEAKTDTMVVIIDSGGEVLISSRKLTDNIERVLSSSQKISRNGEVIEDNWKSGSFIAAATPFDAGDETGVVYMFQDTKQLKHLIAQLNRHFLIAGITTAAMTALIILLLSRIITRPLIKMKEATKELSHGNFSIQLRNSGHDELGELSGSIQSLADELMHVKNERSEFLASISHELRTPLTYIKGYAEIAKRDNLGEAERMEYLQIITEETAKLTRLVTELMQLAQLDRNTFSIQRECFRLADSLESIQQKVLPAFSQENKRLELHCPAGIRIDADPVRFEQMIINLLENARIYSPAGTLTAITARQTETAVEICIQDEGKGIPGADLPYLFERFYRVDKSRSRELGGVGLGLSIVHELIEAHQWGISVRSRLGEGTVFTITTGQGDD